MRRAAHIDSNQHEIVAALRDAGAFVEPKLARLGQGIPDLLVNFRKQWLLFEIKDGEKPLSKRKLTDDELRWHNICGGTVYIVESVEQVLQVLATL